VWCCRQTPIEEFLVLCGDGILTGFFFLFVFAIVVAVSLSVLLPPLFKVVRRI
jgi:hypothetical protein